MRLMSLLLVFFLVSCEDNGMVGFIPPCNSEDVCADNACEPELCEIDSSWFGLDTLWAMEVDGTGNTMEQSEDFIILSGAEGLDMYIKAFSKADGKQLWSWTDSRFGWISSVQIHEQTGRVILQKDKTIIALNLQSGEKLLEYNPSEYYSEFTYGYLEEDNYYYYTVESTDRSDKYIIRSAVSDLHNWEIIFKLSDFPFENESAVISGMAEYDGNLFFKCGLIGGEAKSYVVSVNVATHDINWIYEVSGKNGNNLRQVTIKDNVIYHVAVYGVHALSVHSGELIWSRIYEDNDSYSISRFENTIYSQEGNVIWFYTDYIDSDGGALCMDAETGEVIYDREFNAFDINTVSHHKGIMYFGSQRGILYAARTSDGQVLWDTEDQIPFGKYYADCVVLDQEREVLYGFNGQELVAINIAED